jgi:hypothetical protein
VSLVSIAFTVYTPVYSTITAVCVIYLYVSYVIPTALGLWAHGRTWKKMGPWQLGAWYKPLAAVSVAFCIALVVIGVQPPNAKALWIVLGSAGACGVGWFAFERTRFAGPPQGVLSAARQHEIEEEERAVGEAS